MSNNETRNLRKAQADYACVALMLKDAAQRLREAKTECKRVERKIKREEIKTQHAIARKERAKQRFLERRTKGLCRSCGKQAAPSKHKNSKGGRLRFCETHQAVQRESQRKRKGVVKPRIT